MPVASLLEFLVPKLKWTGMVIVCRRREKCKKIDGSSVTLFRPHPYRKKKTMAEYFYYDYY
jgi:hypothetical protein